MRIAIFGATGRVGTSASGQAHGAGHAVVMHARMAEKADPLQAFGEVIIGPIDDPATLARVVEGAEVVLCTLGTTSRKPNTELSEMILGIITAMENLNVGRLVCVTSLGCGPSYAQVSSMIMRWIIRGPAKEIWADKSRQEAHIMQSGLDYVIVRPGGLSKKPAKGIWHSASETAPLPKKQMIPIDDVATYCIEQCERPSRLNAAISLVSS